MKKIIQREDQSFEESCDILVGLNSDIVLKNENIKDIKIVIEKIIKYSDHSLIYWDDLIKFSPEELEKLKQEIIPVIARNGTIKIIVTSPEWWTPEFKKFLGTFIKCYPKQFKAVYKWPQNIQSENKKWDEVNISNFVVWDGKKMRISFLEHGENTWYASFNDPKTAKALINVFEDLMVKKGA